MGYPNNCSNCPHYRCCDTAMNMKGCKFYFPKAKQENWLKKFFRRFSSK